MVLLKWVIINNIDFLDAELLIKHFKMLTFKDFGLSAEIQTSLDELGFINPTPIQAKTIPFILESRQNLIALAQTGTGKTAGFALPILNQLKADTKGFAGDSPLSDSRTLFADHQGY